MEQNNKSNGNKSIETSQPELTPPKESLPIILSDSTMNLREMVEQAEKQFEFIRKIKTISLKVTNESDWCEQDGKPYLELMGTMKIRQLWNVSISDQHIEREEVDDEKGRYIIYTCYGNACFRDREIQDIGTCSTRDALYGMKGGALKDIEEVDLENVKKKAVTNFQNRILKKILGLSFTWEELEGAGLKREKIGKVEYKRTITEEDKKLQDELKTILKEVYANEAVKIKEWLVKATEFTGRDKDGKPELVKGIDAVERLVGKRLEICLHKAHEAKRKFDAEVK